MKRPKGYRGGDAARSVLLQEEMLEEQTLLVV